LSTFLIKANFSGGHDLTAAIALGVELYLEIAERVASCASVLIKLNERHGTSGNDGDDCVGTLSAFACDRDLISGGADNGDAALIFLFSRAPKRVGALIFDEFCKLLNILVRGVLRDSEIELDGFTANTSTGTNGYAGVGIGCLILGPHTNGQKQERENI
jgi:hypothetical protein